MAAEGAAKPAAKKGGGGGGKAKGGGGGADPEKLPKPAFWAEREKLWDELWARQQAEHAARERPIKVRLMDGKEVDAIAWKTTPLDIAKGLSNSLPDKVFVARVNGQLWDLNRPFEAREGNGAPVTLELLDWDNADAKYVFWHSSAHVLGSAMELLYGAQLSTGPPQPEEKGGGFFYEADTPSGVVSEGDYGTLDSIVKKVTGGKHPFQRLVVSKEDALRLFGYNKFKVATLSDKVQDGATCTVYRCGPLIDPCRGPHVPSTGRIKAMKVHKNSSSYWRNKDTNPVLQRIYGISFPKADQLKEWEEMRKQAEEMDHRKVGVRQGLWMFNDLSPGSCFWYPKGAKIYNKLQQFIRGEYRRRGFEEVVTPNMYNKKLWETSGHWEKYREDMFRIEVERDEFALKPMNCPGHCLMFAAARRSYKELPIRFADFGVLHRNELAGALTGLTRVRRFQQDDAHIFCLPEQLVSEMAAALDFVEFVYGVFGFRFHLALSTRPEARLGSAEIWDVAEAKLRESLNAFCGISDSMPDPFRSGETFRYNGTEDDVKKLKKLMESPDSKVRHIWRLNAGDGAFYGPKIDIRVEDAMRRMHQLGTVQLDFNLPRRFDLTYAGAERHEDAAKDCCPGHDDVGLVTPAGNPFRPSEENPLVSQDGYLKSHCLEGDEAKELLIEKQKTRPVMIHRAILGSIERCVAILAEHWAGKWPFWVSPRQVMVVPVAAPFFDYARRVKDRLYGEGYDCDVELSDLTLPKKVRNAQVAQYNFILVVGEEEEKNGAVAVRTRDNQQHGSKTVEEMLSWFAQLCRERPMDL